MEQRRFGLIWQKTTSFHICCTNFVVNLAFFFIQTFTKGAWKIQKLITVCLATHMRIQEATTARIYLLQFNSITTKSKFNLESKTEAKIYIYMKKSLQYSKLLIMI